MDMKAAALRLAELGFPLLPSNPKDKIAMLKGWPEKASTDGQFISEWWDRKRPPNIGLLTGRRSGVFVLDVDVGKGGDESLAALEAKHGRLPKTATVITGSGGLHYYFKYTDGIHNSVSALGAGLDVRGDGGYVVAPPSVHDSGGVYTWAPGRSIEETPVVEAPAWLLGLLRGDSLAKSVKTIALGQGELVSPGERHRTMASLAGSLFNYGFDEEMLQETLSLFWAHRCDGEPERGEIDRTVKSAVRTFKENPPRLGMDGTDIVSLAASEDIGADIAALFSKYLESVVEHPNATQLNRHNSRPIIGVDSSLGRHVEALDAVLAQDGNVFRGLDGLVELLKDKAGARLVRLESIQARASRLACWKVLKKGDWVEVDPPPNACHELAKENTTRHIKRINGVATFPSMLPGGRYRAETGLDEETGVFFTLDSGLEGLELPEKVSEQEACSAVDELLEPLCDFVFTNDRSKAIWLAALLTPLARRAIRGPVPMFGFSATIRGSGKSKLCDVIATIVTGSSMPRGTYTDDENEMRKAILSMAMESRTMCLYDNLAEPIGGAVLDAALTGDSIDGRILGTNTMAVAPWSCVLFATGNNLATKGDTVRRILRCDIVTETETPENRTGFRYPNLLAHVLDNRKRLLRAALVVLKHHFDAGVGVPGERPTFGSFEAWSDVVRGAVIRAMGVDPYVPPPIEEDDEAQAYRQFVTCLKNSGAALLTKDIVEAVEASRSDESAWFGSEEALRYLARLRSNERLEPITVGLTLKRYVGRVCNGVGRLARKPVRGGVFAWFVEE